MCDIYFPKGTAPLACPDGGCLYPCATRRRIALERDSLREDVELGYVYTAICYQLSPPERFTIPYEAAEADIRSRLPQVEPEDISDLRPMLADVRGQLDRMERKVGEEGESTRREIRSIRRKTCEEHRVILNTTTGDDGKYGKKTRAQRLGGEARRLVDQAVQCMMHDGNVSPYDAARKYWAKGMKFWTKEDSFRKAIERACKREQRDGGR